MLLHTSFHPDFMQDGRDRQMFLCSLFKQYEATQGDKGVVKCEIKDMLNMDIPYFYLNTSGKSLFGSEGEKIEDYFEYTSLEHLKKKSLSYTIFAMWLIYRKKLIRSYPHLLINNMFI
jgi:lantibiotic modifying enzyme